MDGLRWPRADCRGQREGDVSDCNNEETVCTGRCDQAYKIFIETTKFVVGAAAVFSVWKSKILGSETRKTRDSRFSQAQLLARTAD